MRLLLVLACLLSAVAPAPARAADGTATLREWTVPWPDSRPRDPSVAPDGRIWFVGQRANYLAVFDPGSETFSRHDLPEGTAPHTVVVDEDGAPWIAGNGNGTILRFDPGTGRFDTHVVPETPGVRRRDPHTFAFDGKGGLWFTMQRGNAIGRLAMASGEIRIAPVPTADALPYGIDVAADGRPWAVLLGTNKLAWVDPDTFAVTEVALPRAEARPRRLALTGDGRIWYGDFARGWLGAYDPRNGGFDEWRLPSGRSGPYAMAADHRGRVWLVETYPDPNLLQGLDPATGKFFPAAAIASGGGSVRHMVFDPRTRSLWFGTAANTLGRAPLPD